MVSDIRKFKIYTLNNDFIKETDMLPFKFTGIANYYDNVIVFYKNCLVHREEYPACKHANGAKEYYIEGKRHRLDGPAVETLQGHSEYWVNGFYYTKIEHDLLYSIMKLKGLL